MSEPSEKPGLFSRILAVLGKLGIVKIGGKAAVYKSGRDRPAEFLSSDELDIGTPSSKTNDP
ncbi:MAG: hypothetical protein K0M60_12295 [Hydrogenophaga sp.]|nr:hypothetical protein [Hydrogenophaga sp.]